MNYCGNSLYADDAKMYSKIADESCILNMQKDVENMVQWCEVGRLQLNPDKCFLIQYNPRSQIRQLLKEIQFCRNNKLKTWAF